jgi:ketol-acid reductoisomerase
MRYSISDTAEYGDYTGGPRIITAETRKEMKKILKEIQDGSYAKAWIDENRTGRAWFEQRRREEREGLLEKVGRDLRAHMPFLNPVDVADKTSAS